jgi:threonylcarbamoyladenosine tRNA methylthiotransferase MtaB
MPEVKGIVDNSDREHLAEKIIQAAGYVFDGSDLFAEDDSLPFGRVRSFIRVQDGCDGKCSYCIVPSVRGNPVSRPFEDVMRHARKSIAHGVRELVLTGITIGRYESGGYDLAGLAESIMNIEGDFRIRITSIEPRHMNDRLASLFASPKLAPHSHLPLQSGSDSVLSRMNRPYTRQEFIDVVNLIRTKCPDIAIGTDVIVGYPGETDIDFEQTLSLVRDVSFSYVHQFTYSARSGTPSSADKGCDHQIVMSRSKKLRTMTDMMTREYAESFIGKHDMAVIERDGEGLAARTGHYLRLPLAPQEGVLPGDYREVEIRSIDDTLKACII